jgi:drug/metabolite transporter (DMT)-like permease
MPRLASPALVALLTGAAFIGLSPIWVRVADVGPTASAFWRVALAVPVLWIVLAFLGSDRSPPLRVEWKAYLAAGAAFAGDMAFWHSSIKYTSVANSTLLANLAAIFVPLAAWLLWRQRPTGLFIAGLALALAGVAMLVRTSVDFSPTALFGDFLGVITAMFYAWYIFAATGLRDRGASVLRFMAVTTTLSALMLLPVALASGEILLPQSGTGWAKLAGLAVVSHCAGQGLIAYGLGHLPASFSAVGLLVQPVTAGFFAWLLLGEPLVALQVAGGVVVLAGISLAKKGSA